MSATQILVVDDEPDIRDLLREILEDEGYSVAVAEDADSARRARLESPPDLALLDIWMPDVDGITLLKEWQSGDVARFPVIMMSGHGTIETAVEATRLGAFDFVEKPLSLAKLLVTVRAALAPARGPEPVAPMRARHHRTELVGTGRPMTELRERISRIAQTDLPVLVRGEPGAGKHTVARLIHEQSRRADAPWVEFDVGRVGTEGVEAALFGAHGAWQRAGGGTLLVVDLAELDLRVQGRLADRVAGAADPAGPRLIGLSAEDLPSWVEQRRFRSDLFHALNATVLRVPALRDHAEDVPELLTHFVTRLVDSEGLPYRRFTVAAQNRLRNHDWPGNVAELAALVRRVLLLEEEGEVDVAEIERVLAELRPQIEVPVSAMPLPLDLPLREARDAFERAYLQHQLRLVGGRIGELARRVGMERTHLYRKLRALGIDHQSRGRS